MNRRWLLTGTAAVFLAMVVYMFDHGRAARALAAAYTVRDAGERALSEATSDPRADLWAEASRKAASSIHGPILLGRNRVLALEIAAKHYDELNRMPRGTWLTFTREIADGRSRLDAAISAVETRDVSASTREEMRALSQGDIARIEERIAAAHAKATEGPGVAVTATPSTPPEPAR